MRTKRKIKALLTKPTTAKWASCDVDEEIGVELPLETNVNWLETEIFMKKLGKGLDHLYMLRKHKINKLCHIKIINHSRKSFRRNK